MIKTIFLALLTVVSINANAASDEIILKNKEDLKWEKMLPDLGEDSPRFAILRIDPKTGKKIVSHRLDIHQRRVLHIARRCFVSFLITAPSGVPRRFTKKTSRLSLGNPIGSFNGRSAIVGADLWL
jgi:hypothetical protein